MFAIFWSRMSILTPFRLTAYTSYVAQVNEQGRGIG